MGRAVFLVPIFLVGCMASSPQRPANPDYGTKPSAREAHAAIRQDLRKHLKDPDSVKDFALAPPSPDCLYDERGWECGWKICASYNAKNSYGAYIGARVYVYLLRGPNFWAGGSLDNGQCPAYIDPTQDWKD